VQALPLSPQGSFFRHPEASPISKEGRFLATLEMKRLVGDASLSLGTTGEECHPEPLFLSPRGVSRGVSLRYRPERCEGCLATLGRTKNGRSAGQRWAVPPRRKPRCLLFIVLLEKGDTLVYLDNFFWHAKIFSR
jgi:hypothetical protein